MDVRNGSDAWDLRCMVRERLVAFLQKNYPGSLPRYRGEMEMLEERGKAAIESFRGAQKASAETPHSMKSDRVQDELRRSA